MSCDEISPIQCIIALAMDDILRQFHIGMLGVGNLSAPLWFVGAL